MHSLLAVTLDQALRGLLTLFILIAIAGISAVVAGCFSPAPRSSLPALSSPLPARPAIAHDQASGMFTWNYLAANGVMVHQSPMAFHARADLIAHYAEVRRIMQEADHPTTIERLRGDDGKFRWSLYNETTGQRMEITDQPWSSANAARANYDTLRAAVLATPPHDLDETTIPF